MLRQNHVEFTAHAQRSVQATNPPDVTVKNRVKNSTGQLLK